MGESTEADDERARLTARIAEIALEFERLFQQQEARFAEEEQRESTISAALRRMTADASVDVAALKDFSGQMKQRFTTTMTEFAQRLERLKVLHEETLSIVARLEEPAHQPTTDLSPPEAG